MKEITKKQALMLVKTKFWEEMDYKQIAKFQLFAKRLCMPFSVFHEALEKTLGRPVYTHEMGLNWDGLCKELNGEVPMPTLEEIINLIPEDKRVVIEIRKEK